MSHKIFAYCERGSDPGFWAEPINAITNIAFILAAASAWGLRNRQARKNRRIADAFLIVLVALIGIGSFLFHTIATRWAAMADVMPIMTFMIAYLGYALANFVRLPWYGVVSGLVLFVVGLAFADDVICGSGKCLNGSAGYLPALAALFVVGILAWMRRHPAAGSLILAGVLLAVSLTFRTIDFDTCAATRVLGLAPLGTHFLWHIFNATLLLVLLRAAVLYGGTPPNSSVVASGPG